MAALEAAVGEPLPRGFREYLLACDGQDDDGDFFPLVGHNRFLGVDEMLATMAEMAESFLDEAVPGMRANRLSPVIWDGGWIPFSRLDAQLLILDLHPGPRGTKGQIFQYWPGFDAESDDVVFAPSFDAFAAELLRRLVAGEFTLSDGVLTMDRPDGSPWVV